MPILRLKFEKSLLCLMSDYDHTIGHEPVVQFSLVRNKVFLDTDSIKSG